MQSDVPSQAARPRAGGNWFVGAWPSPRVAAAVAAWSALAFEDGAWRRGDACDLHATVAFLGPLDGACGARLAEVLREELHGLRPARLRFGELGGFPVEELAKRVAYLRVDDDAGGLWWREAAERVARACVRSGLPRPEAGTPHLTVARPRSARAPLPATPAAGWDVEVDVLHLACRAEGPRNGRYMSFARLPLG